MIEEFNDRLREMAWLSGVIFEAIEAAGTEGPDDVAPATTSMVRSYPSSLASISWPLWWTGVRILDRAADESGPW